MTVILQLKKGSGAQGAVYQGFIKNKNEQVAIKINTELSERESQILNFIKIQKQKHLIRIDAIENYQNQVIIVMELAEMDFYQFMATDQFKATSIEERNQFFYQVHQLFIQMIQGVQEFHNLGYFHRDLKPENFVLCRNQNQNLVIKLIDFGISKQQEDGLQSMKVGTPFYMTKEILNNETYSKSIDVWALGCIWYEILTGKTFIEGNNVQQIILYINGVSQVEIDFKIDQLKRIQNEQKEILKQMICIDKNKRISLDDAIKKLNEFFKKNDIEKIEAELKKEYEEKEKQLNLEKQKKIEELQQQLEQEKEIQIQLYQQQLKSEYDQKIQKKEIELKKNLELKQGQDKENREQQLLQQTISYQNEINQFKTQCELDYKQKLNEQKQRESLEKKQKIENEEMKKKINEQAKQQYEIELNKILKQQQLEADNQQKKAQFQNKRQSYGQVLSLLKDSIQNAISTMNQQKQIIIEVQLENQDKQYLLNSIQKFINDKEQELNQLYQEQENFNSLDENVQFSKFVELETRYKNQIQIHSEEKSIVDIQIYKFMADQVKKQEQMANYVKKQEQMAREERQLQEEQKNKQEMKNLNFKFQMLNNQYIESQKQIQEIMKICENYFQYNQTITNNFQRLKDNSNQIASRINYVQQYLNSTQMVTIEQIQLIKFEIQEIQKQFQTLEVNIISVNESISIYEQEQKKQMQQYLGQIQDIEYKIHIQIQQYNLTNNTILIQLQEKQQLMKQLSQKLDNLIISNISESIKEFMEIQQKYEEIKSQVRKLAETLQNEQLSLTKIKLISEEQKKFQKELETKSNNYQQQIDELVFQLNPIQQNCNQLQNKEIIQLLNTRFQELNSLKKDAKYQFDGLIQESKQNLKTQQELNQLKEKGNIFFSELVGKKDQYQIQIIELNRIYDSIFKSEQDNKLKEIFYSLELLILTLQGQHKLIYTYIQNLKTITIMKLRNNIQQKFYKKAYDENDSVTKVEEQKLDQNSFFKDHTKRYLKEKSQQFFSKLKEIINEIDKQKLKIHFIEVEKEQKIQNEWLVKQQLIMQLNPKLLLLQNKINWALTKNSQDIDKLSEEFKKLSIEVDTLFHTIPSKEDINTFQVNFNRNKKSFMITCLLIIILKAFNFQRYAIRLKEFQETQQYKQEKRKVQLKKQIVEKKENTESAKIELQKLEQKKNTTNRDENKEKVIDAQNIMDKYKSWLQSEELIINIEEYIKDETNLDTQTKAIQTQINTQNNVKLKATIKDQKFNKEFSSEFYDQLEYCRTLGILKMQKLFYNEYF
ncbi:unnamed protein product (macronuclear) [Paramecium tetraurelia]|uniref:Protein kinase domain-containing protein n=1 Tax=Paramecium tetraurelia TaxID=5888 RepID=A0CIP5_PARTE|nr:uncharacterized protein GSPATT00007797001 [Paramecium tetraurelia]CAK70662.1 unnamed protein product [Paramecium tetraurelia]|eukprot:XP_001438059.1 hypothetical protein (macronuclear) [Paramecium tetraurelia strain d4-2]